MKYTILLCLLSVSPYISAQALPSEAATDQKERLLGGTEVREVEQRTEAMEVVVQVDPDYLTDFGVTNLVNMAGERVIPTLEKVTVVEYWSRKTAGNSLYWKRMRELEKRFKNSPDVEFISINYDHVYNGQEQRQMANIFVKELGAPATLYFDVDDGVRELFSLPGTMGYMLFDNYKRYLAKGRGDDPETVELFDKMEKAIAKKQEHDAFNMEHAKKN